MKHTEREREVLTPGDEKLEPSQEPEEDADSDENGGVLKTDRQIYFIVTCPVYVEPRPFAFETATFSSLHTYTHRRAVMHVRR